MRRAQGSGPPSWVWAALAIGVLTVWLASQLGVALALGRRRRAAQLEAAAAEEVKKAE